MVQVQRDAPIACMRQHKTKEQHMGNKVAMVVGGGSGMGAAAARKLAQDGFQVAVLSSSGKG